MSESSVRPTVGLLGLTLELYESLAPTLRASRERWVRRELVAGLERTCRVLFDGALYRREDIEAAVARFEAAGADALLVVLLTYAPSQLALPALRQARLPIVIWNTQELWAVDEGFTSELMIDNHGVHGTQDLSNVLLRAGVPFHFLTGHPREPEAWADLNDFLAAAAVCRRVRHARLGTVGYPFPGMGDFALDTTRLAATLGCSWLHLSVEEYIQRAASAPAGEVAALVETYTDQYDVAPGVTPADLAATARVELALRGMVREHRLDALTYQFLAFGEDERTPTLPFVAASRLMADGVGFGGEGDLIGALGTAVLHALQPPASFTEIFTIDFAGNSLFLSHMGEANVAMARRDRPVPLVARPTPIARTRERQLALVTSFEPGPATFMALTQAEDQRWRLIASLATLEDYGPLASWCVPHSKLRPHGNVRDFLTAYARVGGPHHHAICFGDARRRIRRLAEMLGADYREI